MCRKAQILNKQNAQWSSCARGKQFKDTVWGILVLNICTYCRFAPRIILLNSCWSERLRAWSFVFHLPRKSCIAPINNHTWDRFPEAGSKKHLLSDLICIYNLSSHNIYWDSGAILLSVSSKKMTKAISGVIRALQWDTSKIKIQWNVT